VGCLVTGGVFFLVAWVSHLALGRTGLGGGDIKLAGLIGATLGGGGGLVAAFVGIMLGGVAAAGLLVTGQRRFGEYLPFGPFLAAGALTGGAGWVLEKTTAGQTRTKTLTLRNTGGIPMHWDLKESGGGAAAPSARQLQKNPSYDPRSRTTDGLYLNQSRVHGTPAAPGDVIRSWSPGLELGWGVGYNGNVWISDVDGGACGPTCTDNKYNVAGPPILQTITTPWANAWPADMALMGANEMCQVNVGGDNGIYCWDTSTGASTRHIAGAFAWTGISQRGLAYRPDDDSFYIGGWNEGILYHVAGFSHPTPGAVLGQCFPADPNISGLAWNPAVGQVWMATNSPSAVSTSASAIPADTAPMPPDPVEAMPTNALMTPTTVPSRPTNGAVEPIVASVLTPFFRSDAVSAVAR